MKNFDLMTRIESQKKAKGGTEQMQERLYGTLERALLEKFQIWFSRFDMAQFDPGKIQILYCHDLPGDPMYDETLSIDGRKKFLKICFVSNWQMQLFINHYRLDWSQCFVLPNAIEPIEDITFPKDLDGGNVKLIYHTTPHRGLEILAHVFGEISRKYPVTLDIFSSFSVYGQAQRDLDYGQLFDYLRQHPKVQFHGGQPNSAVRNALISSHIFAYPSIWPETSCIALMEAMSAGNIAVHPNFAALFETAANNTVMYQMQDNTHDHACIFQDSLENTIQSFLDGDNTPHLSIEARDYANKHHNWGKVANIWRNFLSSMISLKL
jgi:glycosyltransferase involved in cell wall biosynthesis